MGETEEGGGQDHPNKQACPLPLHPRGLAHHPKVLLPLDLKSLPRPEERKFLGQETELGRGWEGPGGPQTGFPGRGSVRAQGRHSPGAPHLGSTWPGPGPVSAPGLWSGRCVERECWPGPQPCSRGPAWPGEVSGHAGVLEQGLGRSL